MKSLLFDLMDKYSSEGRPFFFLIDFDINNIEIYLLEELQNQDSILIQLPSYSNFKNEKINSQIILKKQPISIEDYKQQFNVVMDALKKGDSYLINLTGESPIRLNLSLKEIFHASKSKYKLLFKNNFVCFSPETFVKIKDNKIYTYPMKGTIDAGLDNAEQLLLNNEKEKAEHYTIVDLLRNDLSLVADNVQVSKFRYVEKISTNQKNILQTSSEIVGKIKDEYKNKIGNILKKLLPAGSVTGAPKQKTVEIIKHAETHKRGYYTGIFGIFDGRNLDSAVTIRFIENRGGSLYYKSGGGITYLSNMQDEYNELINKIYVPLD